MVLTNLSSALRSVWLVGCQNDITFISFITFNDGVQKEEWNGGWVTSAKKDSKWGQF